MEPLVPTQQTIQFAQTPIPSKKWLREQIISVNFPISSETQGYFSNKLGDSFNIVGRSDQMPHSHPQAHIERAVVERYILGRCAGQRVVDAGGNAIRHLKNDGCFKTRVHSCCPILDIPDIQRQTNREFAFKSKWNQSSNYCNHTIQDCSCGIKFDVMIGVDVLYYLTPLQIVQSMAVHRVNRAIFSIHTFPNASGQNHKHKDGTFEIEYTRIHGGNVKMKAKGNTCDYVHSAVDWISQNSFELPRGCSLVWNKIRDIGITSIFEFQFCDFSIPQKQVPSISRINDVFSRNQDVMISKVDIDCEATQRFMPFKLINATIMQRQQIVTFIDEDRQINLPVKGIMGLVRMAAHKERTQILFEQLVGIAKTQANNVTEIKALNEFDKALYVTYGPVIAMTLNLEVESEAVSVLRNVRSAAADYQTEIDRAFKSQTFIDKVLYAITDLVGLTRDAVVVRPVRVPEVTHQELGFVQTVMQYMPDSHTQTLKGIFPKEGQPQKHCPKAVQEFSQTVQRCAGSIYSELDLPIGNLYRVTNAQESDVKIQAVNSTIVVRTRNEIQQEKLGCTIYGMTLTQLLPVVPMLDQSATTLSLQNKVCASVPDANQPEWRQLGKFISEHQLLIFGETLCKVEPMPYHKWFQKYNMKQQRLILNCVQKYCDGFSATQLDNECNRKMFPKQELLDKRSELIVPRPIQSVGTLANYLLSPWMNAFVAKLHSMWHIDHSIVYASGLLPEQMGDWYTDKVKLVDAGSHFLFENDFSQYDQSISASALGFEFGIYAQCKVKATTTGPIQIDESQDWAKYVLNKQLRTKGYDKYSTKYTTEGNRKSGDPNTSCGNSLINAAAHSYCFAKEYCRMNDETLEDFDPTNYENWIMILGDDNIACVDNMFYNYVKDGGLAFDLLTLGFTAKVVLRESVYSSEFCSQRFWKVGENDGTKSDRWILGPKVARWLSRHAITTNILNPVQRKQYLIDTIKSAYCVASFVPIVREACDFYRLNLGDQDLNNWYESKCKKDSTTLAMSEELRKVSLTDDWKHRGGATKFASQIDSATVAQFETIYQTSYKDVVGVLRMKMGANIARLRDGAGIAFGHPLLSSVILIDNENSSSMDHNLMGLEQAAVSCENGS